jgi:outer membrane protein OmpA-like peptidoglycan-associated protein
LGACSSIVCIAESSTALDGEATKTLDALCALLKAEPALHLQLDSFCDDPCSQEASLALAQRRAEETAAYLERGGIVPDRMFLTSGGNAHMLVSSESAAGLAYNRRVELRPVY